MKKIVAIIGAVVVIAVVIILLASGNTSAPESKNSPSPSPTATASSTATPSASTTPAPSATASSKPVSASVIISNFAFTPLHVTVAKGSTVTWTNKDAVAHTVTETDGKNGPKSGDLNQNQTYSFTYNEVGTFKYECSIHPYMTGTVTVTD